LQDKFEDKKGVMRSLIVKNR